MLTAVICLGLYAATPQTLNLVDLSLEFPVANSSFNFLQEQPVRVRGFWYPISSDEGVLAPEPHLKSCCLRAPATINQQLIVKGALASLSAQRAVTLEGIFRVDPRYNSEGQLIQFFVLEEAQEVTQSHLPIIITVIAIFVLFLFLWWIVPKFRQS